MNTIVPFNEPTANARLPANYEQAKQALAECVSIDECKTWADKAEALKSYARQADDDDLYKHAIKVQVRAVRRCGELLKQFDARGGDRSKTDTTVTSAPTQKQAARAAGLSERKQVTAVRVANVPDDEFEEVIEGDERPTITSLAERGLVCPKPW